MELINSGKHDLLEKLIYLSSNVTAKYQSTCGIHPPQLVIKGGTKHPNASAIITCYSMWDIGTTIIPKFLSITTSVHKLLYVIPSLPLLKVPS